MESVFHLCRHLVEAGCSVRVLTTDANGRNAVLDVEKDREVEVVPGLPVRYCPRMMLSSVSPALLSNLSSYVRWADTVHLTAVYSFPTIPTLWSCKRLRKPVVWSPRGSLQRWEGTRRPSAKFLWEAVCLRAAPGRVCLHTTSADERRETLARFPSLKTALIPNGVEIPTELHRSDRNGPLRLLSIGRLDPKKGVENLLLACNLLHQRGTVAFSLTLAGSGDPPYEAKLRALIRELRLQGHVAMVGPVIGDSKRETFERSDVMVLPSHTENFGLVVAEALAHGVPVIASKGSPWSELESVGCGLHVENSPESLARSVERMAELPLREMGSRGRAWMQREFDWKAVAARTLALYREVRADPP
jgi:glycosyltransferase involved in cell wall biosynthesis